VGAHTADLNSQPRRWFARSCLRQDDGV